nr:glycosyltransferase [Moraxella caviae]
MHFLGNGSQLESLQNAASNYSSVTVFHGHCSDVFSKLREFSFYMLTSISEGLPVALLEAMAAGCIPIAYNIDFGPSDVITHGQNGWLVEPGNIDQLKEVVLMASSLPDEELEKMRQAAIKTAEEYSVHNVLSMWKNCKLQARKRKAEKMSRIFYENQLKNDLTLCK